MFDIMNLVDMAIVGAVIFAVELIKGFDKNNKYVRFYPLIVAALGLLAALFKTEPFAWRTFGYNAMLYVAVPSYIYKFGKTTVMGK